MDKKIKQFVAKWLEMNSPIMISGPLAPDFNVDVLAGSKARRHKTNQTPLMSFYVKSTLKLGRGELVCYQLSIMVFDFFVHLLFRGFDFLSSFVAQMIMTIHANIHICVRTYIHANILANILNMDR